MSGIVNFFYLYRNIVKYCYNSKIIQRIIIGKVVSFSKLPIDYLFVEASGLSDPSNIESIVTQVQRTTNEAFDFNVIYYNEIIINPI
jgi:hypothetical protein